MLLLNSQIGRRQQMSMVIYHMQQMYGEEVSDGVMEIGLSRFIISIQLLAAL